MAFNISNFKSTFDTFGGPARTSLFEIRVTSNTPPPPQQGQPQGQQTAPDGGAVVGADGLEVINVEARRRKPVRQFTEGDLRFFCKSAVIPGITINTNTFEAVAQLPKQFPTTVVNTPFNAIFMVDSDHEVLTFFHKWIQSVLNYDNRDAFAEEGKKLPFEVGYKDEYSKTLQIRHYSTESSIKKFYEVKLYNAFPVSVGDLELAWESNDSYLTLPVTFAYDRVEYSGANTGLPSSRFSRGRNLLQTLGAIAGFTDVVRQTFNSGTPTSIQDAVNRLTRVRSSFDNISRGRGR